jgi:3-deoxy-D-manno-octulosonic-acid transferase
MMKSSYPLFNLFYLLLVTLLYILALPFLAVLSFKKKYRQSIPSRFFLYRNAPLQPHGLWFHSCSLGEARAIKPLLELFNPKDIRLTTTTHTGYSEIDKNTTQSRYLPFELFLPFWIKPQKALIVMEAEYWYFLFAFAKLKGAKVIVINARMSDRSYKNYLRFKWFYQRIFAFTDEVFAQTQTDAKRLETLGAKNITVTGNIKLYKLPKVTKTITKPNGLIVCGASTHPKEEILILEAFQALKAKESKAKLILVPRHPERFGEVVHLAQSFASQERMSFAQYSVDSSLQSDIVVVDRLGELINLYAISDIVIAAGSFEPIGGHNVAEAAQFGCKIISGKGYFNQRDIYRSIENIKTVQKSELTEVLLLHHKLKATKIIAQTDIQPILDSIRKTL